MEKERVKLDWIAASEGSRVAETIEGFVADIKKLGPNPINKKVILNK